MLKADYLTLYQPFKVNHGKKYFTSIQFIIIKKNVHAINMVEDLKLLLLLPYIQLLYWMTVSYMWGHANYVIFI